MPTYDYECESCGHRFEAFQNMSDEPIKRCPECGKKVRRLIGGGLGVIFKGSGFYVTDNKRSGNGAADRHAAKSGSDGAGNGKDSGAPKSGDGAKSGESKAPEKTSKTKESGAAVKGSA